MKTAALVATTVVVILRFILQITHVKKVSVKGAL